MQAHEVASRSSPAGFAIFFMLILFQWYKKYRKNLDPTIRLPVTRLSFFFFSVFLFSLWK
jgi:hypothetical protein